MTPPVEGGSPHAPVRQSAGRSATAVEPDLRPRPAIDNKLFVTLASQAPVGIFVDDPGGACRYVNSRWRAISGLTTEQALEDGWAEALHPDERTAVLAAWHQSLLDGRDFRMEHRYARPDGSVVWVESQANPMLDDAGRTTGWVGTVVDVTDRRAADAKTRAAYAALADLEEQHQTVLTSLEQGVVLLDENRTVVSANPAAGRLLGVPSEDLIGRRTLDPRWSTIQEDGRPWQTERHPALVTMRTGEPVSAATMGLVRPDGEQVWLSVSTRRVSGQDGRVAIVASFVDITEQVESRQALTRREADYRLLAEQSHDLMTRHGPDGSCTYVSPAITRLLGLEPSDLLGRSLSTLAQPDDRPLVDAALTIGAAGPADGPSQQGRTVAWRASHADGSTVWLETAARRITDPATGDVTELVANSRDISERRAAHEALTSFQLVFDHAPIGMSLLSLAGRFEQVNVALAQLTERTTQELLAVGQRDLLHPDDVARWDELVADMVEGRVDSARLEARIHRADDRLVWAIITMATLRDHDGVAHHLITQTEDITARKDAEERLRHMALHDALTGTPNRVLFLDRTEHALRRSERSGLMTAVLFVDLDLFKRVNDSLGHATGDQVLIAVARRLGRTIRPGDTVARLGGDEFAVLCEDLDDLEDAQAVAAHITEALREPFGVNTRSVAISASVGIALGSGRTASAAEILRDADVAMYRAKERGRSRYEVFGEALRARAVERLEIEEELRPAIDRGELALHYQPIWAADGAIVGAEALVRWHRPHRGVVSPEGFLSIANEAGLLRQIDDWVLGEACRQLGEWHSLRPGLNLHVNVSVSRLSAPGYADHAALVLKETGVDPAQVCIELTENDFLLLQDSAANQFDQVCDLGIRSALDDFGTGYSSLAHLYRFRVDVLKIDGSFVQGLGQRPEADAVVRAVVGLARDLKRSTVAEGAETAEQTERAFAIGVDAVQGHFLGDAVPAADFTDLLERRRP